MRTNLHLDSSDSDSAWKRIGFIDKPNRRIWQEMAGVWKARIEWVDDRSLESDDDAIISMNGHHTDKPETTLPHLRSPQQPKAGRNKKVEKLVIGWGDAAWIVHITAGGAGTGKDVGERSVGSAEVVHLYVALHLRLLYTTNKYPAFVSTTVSFLAFRSIPPLCFLFLHTGHAMMTTTQSPRQIRHHDEGCIDVIMDCHLS